MADRYVWRRRAEVLAVWIATALLLEAGLRGLDLFGYRLDAWIGACGPAAPVSPLNHAPLPGRAVQRLGATDVYGRFAGMQYDELYDELGIKRSALRPQDGDGVRVLFMGDSFIEGYDDANTVPQRAYEWVAAHGDAVAPPPIVLNAGYSSYSPLIFTVQADRLLPVLRPDLVVIDIDETDLYDDAVRYRQLAVRDGAGRLTAIDRDPTLAALADGSARAPCHELYLMRVLAAFYYRLRIAVHDWRVRRAERLFEAAQTPDAARSPGLREQMAYFSSTLEELFATLTRHLPAERILVVRHPHREHLHHGGDTPVWNRAVGELVGAAAARHGIAFFDAQDELDTRFAGEPERYYWPGDMHFNFDGIRAYGELVGRELQRTLVHADQKISHGGTETRRVDH